MELSELTESDLAMLLGVFKDLAQNGNRVFFDIYIIIERESVSRQQSTDLVDYADEHLTEAASKMASLVDSLRAKRVPDDYPFLRFILEQLTIIIGEGERREKKRPVH